MSAYDHVDNAEHRPAGYRIPVPWREEFTEAFRGTGRSGSYSLIQDLKVGQQAGSSPFDRNVQTPTGEVVYLTDIQRGAQRHWSSHSRVLTIGIFPC
jgi:hypothetical protein